MKRLRAGILIVCVLLLSAAATGQDLLPRGPAGATETEVAKWLSQGGLTAVLVVVLWSYRRDWQQRLADAKDHAAEERARTEEERARNAAFLAAIEKVTAALSTNTEASRAQAAGFGEVLAAMRLCEVKREAIGRERA